MVKVNLITSAKYLTIKETFSIKAKLLFSSEMQGNIFGSKQVIVSTKIIRLKDEDYFDLGRIFFYHDISYVVDKCLIFNSFSLVCSCGDSGPKKGEICRASNILQ